MTAIQSNNLPVIRTRIYAILIFLHVFAILWGIHSGATLGVVGLMDALFPLIFGGVIIWGCMIDARMLGKPLLGFLPLLMFIFWPVAAPIYLIWSRGWRGMLWAMLWTVTLVACYVVPAISVAIARSGL